LLYARSMPANIFSVNHEGKAKFIEQLFPGDNITLFNAIHPLGYEMSLHVECADDDVKTDLYFFEGKTFNEEDRMLVAAEHKLEVPHASTEHVPFRLQDLGVLALLAEHRHLISTC
jgi:hypothetical protein